MNQSFFSNLNKFVLATASLAMTTCGVSTAVAASIAESEHTGNQLQQIKIDRPSQTKPIKSNVNLPESVAKTIVEKVSQQTGLQISELHIVSAEKQNWADGCLGLANAGVTCTQAIVPGWKVVVSSGEESFVYRTNAAASQLIMDEKATQNVASLLVRGTRSQARNNNRISQKIERRTLPFPQPSITQATNPTDTQAQTPIESPPVAPQLPIVDTNIIQAQPTQPSQPEPRSPKLVIVGSSIQPPQTRQNPVAAVQKPIVESDIQIPVRQNPVAAVQKPIVDTNITGPQARQIPIRSPQRSQKPIVESNIQIPVSQISTPSSQKPIVETNITGPQVRQAPAPSAQRPQKPTVEINITQPQARQTPAPSPQSAPQIPIVENNLQQIQARQIPLESKQGFSLAIRQSSAKSEAAIARISLKAKTNTGYAAEQFIGDFKYKINQQAEFLNGVKPGDRVVVRLYNLSNSLIGSSEFEILPEYTAVNLIIAAQPTSRIVRTVYGIDTDYNGAIDTGTEIYSYFTQITGSTNNQEKITFLSQLKKINSSMFQLEGMPEAALVVYPRSFRTGQYALMGQTLGLFSPNMAPVLTSIPGKVTEAIAVSATNNTYDISQMLVKYSPTAQTTPATSRTTQTTPATSRTTFTDVPINHWAKDFIIELAERKIILGEPNGRYRPDQPVTRAELAAMISLAFKKNKVRDAVIFKDVPTELWYHSYLQEAYERGFIEVDANNVVNPLQNISRLDVLVALARGLNYSTSASVDKILQIYSDSSSIPREVRTLMAGATERGIVVNYPNVKMLRPMSIATRAEVAALIYQAMVSDGQALNISSPYVVGEFEKEANR